MARPRKLPAEQACAGCGRVFTVKNGHPHRYCSVQCSADYRDHVPVTLYEPPPGTPERVEWDAQQAENARLVAALQQ